MDELFILMRFDSLWSIWFWFAHVVCWSLVGHFPLGVPYDMVTLANRENNEASEAAIKCDAMVDASVWRMVTLFRRYGVWITLIWFFLLSILISLGVWFDMELAEAVVTILGPMTLVYATSVHTAFRIERTGARGAEARGLLRRQRLISQFIGFFAISITAALAIYYVVSRFSMF